MIKRGEAGYYPTNYDSAKASTKIAEQAVRELNARLHVTEAQALAMEMGSMFGWDQTGANPDIYR